MNDNELSTALDGLVADRKRLGAPSRLHEKVWAIPTTTRPESHWLPRLDTGRFQSIFSATKFVVAGVIVALFGGFLLTGVLTQPSDDRLPAVGASASATTQAEPTEAATSEPTMEVEADSTTTAPDLLPGVDLVTEEVGPGVYRVLSDGVRDIVRLADDDEKLLGGSLEGNIVAGLDGSVWLFDRSGFVRLGEEGSHRWPKGLGDDWSPRPSRGDIEVGPDGTLWLTYNDIPRRNSLSGGIVSYDGQSWTSRRQGGKKDRVLGIEVRPDGSVWAAWQREDRDRVRVARLIQDGWDELPGNLKGRGTSSLEPSGPLMSQEDSPSIWLIADDGRLRRHDGKDWVVVRTPDAGGEMRAAVGPDGTLWVRLHPRCGPGTEGDRPTSGCAGPSKILARFHGGEWEVYDASYLIPMMGDHYQGFDGFFSVAPDGSIWFNPMDDYLSTGTECDGIANFDGETVTNFLRDTCIYAMDLAPDGTVWLQAGEFRADVASGQNFPDAEPGPIHTYVLTPEAVATTE